MIDWLPTAWSIAWPIDKTDWLDDRLSDWFDELLINIDWLSVETFQEFVWNIFGYGFDLFSFC